MEIVKWCFFFNDDSQSVTHWVSDYITSRTVLKSSQTWGVARPLFYEGRNASLQQIRLAKAKSAKIIHAWMGEGCQLSNEPFDFWLPLLPLGLGTNPPSVTFCKSITFSVTFLCFSKHLREFPHHACVFFSPKAMKETRVLSSPAFNRLFCKVKVYQCLACDSNAKNV